MFYSWNSIRARMLIIEVLIVTPPPPLRYLYEYDPIMSLSFSNNVAPGVGYWGEKKSEHEVVF